MKNHTYFLVTISPWPLIVSLMIFNLLMSSLNMFMTGSNFIFVNMLVLGLCLYQWFRDIIRESTFQGNHTKMVVKILKFGMFLFIVSEVMFFFSFFWALLHSSLSPSIEIGMVWPPMGIKVFNPSSIPLMNTMILLVSGISISWSHYSLLNENFKECELGLMFCIMLGYYFSFVQLFEYTHSFFSISDGIYGSLFFMLTGFHGLHVLIGNYFLLIVYFRLINNHFSSYHHFGYEAACWYWHFVDVVWLFVYLLLY